MKFFGYLPALAGATAVLLGAAGSAFAYDGAQTNRLHETLQIRPEQETAFQTWRAAMARPRGADVPAATPEELGERARPAGAEEAEPMPPLQRLDWALGRAKARYGDPEGRAEATRAFYAVLSPAQQHAFDALDLR